jgi:prepilin-type N-terminal cleavage/methylation domain-containing protein
MKKNRTCLGFTLVEMLVALVIFGLAMGIFCKIFLSQAYGYKVQTLLVQRQQGLRAALEVMARDFRGSGCPVYDDSFLSNLTAWLSTVFIPKVPMTVIPKGILTITPGGNTPDILSLLTVLPSDTNPTRLSVGAQAGETSIRLALSSSEVNDQYNIGDILYIGKPAEPAQIKGISGQILVIDTDPAQPGNQGLKGSYASGTEVGEISLVSYAVFNDDNDPGAKYHDPGVPVLKRKINGGGFEPLTEEITDLKISPIRPELFGLRLSIRTGLQPNGSPGINKPLLTMTTQILKRN